jgi:hypothetical protein
VPAYSQRVTSSAGIGRARWYPRLGQAGQVLLTGVVAAATNIWSSAGWN